MPEFKANIGGTNFKPMSKTVHAPVDTAAATHADLIAKAAMGMGQGFAEEKGRQQLGEGETTVDATAVVDDAFSPEPPTADIPVALNEDEPTRDTMAERKAQFLARADLNDKRLQAALDQGLISSSEANNRRIQNRKEFASNPISAVFIDSYDKVVGGGSAGAGRKAFFGKTAAEKGREAAIQARATQEANDRFLAEELVRTGKVRDLSSGVSLIQESRANKQVLEVLQNKENLTQHEAYRKVDLENDESLVGASKIFFNNLAVEGGLKADQLRTWGQYTAAQKEAARLRIERGNLSVDDQKRAMEDVNNTYDMWTKQLEDASFAKFHENVSSQIEAQDKLATTLAKSKMIRSNPAIWTAWKELGPEFGMELMKLQSNPDSMQAQLFANSDMGKALLPHMTEESVSKLMLDASNLIIKKQPPADRATNDAGAATLTNPKVIEAAMENHTPTELEKTLKAYKGKQLGEALGRNELPRLLNKRPEYAMAVINALVEDSKEVQLATTQKLPTKIEVSPLIIGKGSAPRPKRITSDVKLSDRMLADISATEKYARNNPSIWNTKYETIDDFLNSIFTDNGPLPKEVTPSKLGEEGIAQRMEQKASEEEGEEE